MQRPRKQEQEPASDTVTEVGPGILRMQLPIRMPGLGHVNAYALLDDRGATIVDPGMPGNGTWNALLDRMKQAELRPEQVHTVVVTHSHPDHFGTAGRLAHEAGAELVTHAAFHTWWGPHSHEDAKDVDEVHPDDMPKGNPFTDTPWGGKRVGPPLSRRIMMRAMRFSMRRNFFFPRPTTRLRDGDVIKLAGREWFAVHTPGHTLDHLCLHDPENGLLLSGDHVLPTITPHISGVGSGRDPLKAFFESLDRVAQLPGIENVLPAHGHPFGDLRARVEDIKGHHAERLDKLRAVSASIGPADVEELSHHLFRKARWGPMASSETYAHLEHLRLMGEAERHEENGKLLYEIAPLPTS